MAYSKTEWKVRQGVNLNKFTKSQEAENSVLLTNTPDSITEPGTPFSAENMNHIEEGIADAHDAIEQEAVDRDTAITEAVNTEAADRQEQATETNTRVAALETNDAVQDSDIAQIWDQINQTKHFRGYYATLAEIEALENPSGGDYAYCAEIVAPSTTSNEWIFDSDTSTWIDTGRAIPDQLSPPSDAQPLMDGENSNPGTSNEYSRGDHIHPRHPDTAFVYTDPETGERYDNEQLYGMVKNVEVDKFEEGKSGTIVGASEEDGIGYVRATPDGKGQITGLVELNSLLSMGLPNYALRSTVASSSTNNATISHTVTQKGYIWFHISSNPGNQYVTAYITINGLLFQQYIRGTDAGYVDWWSGLFPVKPEDTIVLRSNGSNGVSNHSINFVPPVINPPAYLEAMPHLDYSTVEQDTYTKSADGKKIYQKTFLNLTRTITEGAYTNFVSMSEVPGLTKIIKSEFVQSGDNDGVVGWMGALINSAKTWITVFGFYPLSSRTYEMTIWYTKD